MWLEAELMRLQEPALRGGCKTESWDALLLVRCSWLAGWELYRDKLSRQDVPSGHPCLFMPFHCVHADQTLSIMATTPCRLPGGDG